MNTWAGHWQQNRLVLAPILTIEKLEGLRLISPEFPASNCVIDASELQQVDSVGVAALIAIRTFADEHGVTLTWRDIPTILTNLLDLYDINTKEMIE